MNNTENIPQYLIDFSNYLIGIKNLSNTYVKNIVSTVKQFLEFINKHILKEKYDNIKEIELNDIRSLTNSDIYSYLYYLAQKHYKTSSRITKTEFLRNFFDYLFKIKHNLFQEPFKKIKKDKIENNILPNYLSIEESKKLLNRYTNSQNILELRNNAILHLLLNSGLRLSEIQGLNLDDFNLDNNTFRIIGKGDKERTGYLNQITKDSLLKYIKERNNLDILGKDKKALFINFQQMKRITQRGIQKMVKTAYKDCGLNYNKYTVHTLRHTCATLLYRNGIDIKIIKELLGHAEIETTDIYTHLYDKDVEKEMLNHPLNKFKISDALAY